MRRTNLTASIGLAFAFAAGSTIAMAAPPFAFPGQAAAGFTGKANGGLFPPSTLDAPLGAPKESFPGQGVKLTFPGQGQGLAASAIGNRPAWLATP